MQSLVPVDLVGHDVVEVVGSDEAVVVEVGLHEDLLDFLVSEVLAEVVGDLLELVDGEFALDYGKDTALLMSKDTKTLSTSALLSLSDSLAVASLRNSAKSIPPDWSSSSSARIW